MAEEQNKRVIGVPLEGEDLELFDQYKHDEIIKQDAVAGRKLLVERLRQLRKEREQAA